VSAGFSRDFGSRAGAFVGGGRGGAASLGGAGRNGGRREPTGPTQGRAAARSGGAGGRGRSCGVKGQVMRAETGPGGDRRCFRFVGGAGAKRQPAAAPAQAAAGNGVARGQAPQASVLGGRGRGCLTALCPPCSPAQFLAPFLLCSARTGPRVTGPNCDCFSLRHNGNGHVYVFLTSSLLAGAAGTCPARDTFRRRWLLLPCGSCTAGPKWKKWSSSTTAPWAPVVLPPVAHLRFTASGQNEWGF